MSGFSAEWLALREPHDAQARCRRLERGLRARRVIDLGSGTGANWRYLAPKLGGEWHLVDKDAGLLARAGTPNVHVVDLARCPLPDLAADLVTASALLDLVSADWLKSLIALAKGRSLFLVLSYDGRVSWQPALPDDDAVTELLNHHQGRDKGFGPALGPAAAEVAVRLLRGAGYAVATGTSDWRLNGADRAIQLQLIAGWAAAAREMAPGAAGWIGAWATRRRSLVTSGRSRLTVGHVDLLATQLGCGAPARPG